MRSRKPIRSPGAACLIAPARNTEGSGDDASPDVWLRSPRVGRGGSGPVPQPAEDLPVQVRAHPERAPGQLLQDSPCAGRGDRAGLDPGQQEAEEAGVLSTFRLGNGPCRDLVEDEAVSLRRLEQGRLANPQAEGRPPLPVALDGTPSIPDPWASRRGWDSRPVKTSSAIGGGIAICPKRSRRTRTSPLDSRAISVEASTQTRMGQTWTQAPVRSRSLRSSSSEIRKKGIPFAAARSAMSRMGTPAYWAARLRVNSRFRYRARAFSIRGRRTPSRRADLAISDRESRISWASSSRSSISSSSTRTWRIFI